MGKDVGPKSTDGERVWLNDLEFPDANIKWAFSNFDGRAGTFNDEGDHNFVIIVPDDMAHELMAIPDGWAIKEKPALEEGDPPEYHLKVKISYRFEAPAIYIIKGDRRFRADESDLADIKKSTVEKIDVIVSPSRWYKNGNAGVSAYVKEMYVTIRESRFAAEYADYEEVQ